MFQIKAVGYCLPMSDKIRYDMQGKWSKNSKHGLQFEVETYDEVIIPSKEGIIAYLSSGQISGIGPALAKRIYDTFGDTTLDVLDKEPEKLLTISGISQKKLEKIRDSYLANRGARDVVAFLTPHGVSANRAVKLYLEYGNKTMDIVKNHPYQLCELAGIGFLTADKIAKSMGVSELSVSAVGGIEKLVCRVFGTAYAAADGDVAALCEIAGWELLGNDGSMSFYRRP